MRCVLCVVCSWRVARGAWLASQESQERDHDQPRVKFAGFILWVCFVLNFARSTLDYRLQAAAARQCVFCQCLLLLLCAWRVVAVCAVSCEVRFRFR